MMKFSKLWLVVAFLASAALFAAACAKHEGGDAAANRSQKPSATIENPSEPLKITVSRNGFEPKSIEVRRGQPVRLAFERTDTENCGDEIVFPAQNIRKSLPVGEIVPVEFAAADAGEITFTCGMDMLRGKIVVQ